jgi:serine phosphatase RsbU (regulator of sigma subunit)
MNLRARLIIAFFVLAVVPLASIVTYSYATSLQAFRQAVEAEAASEAERLRQRVSSVGEGLDQVLERASRDRFPALVTADGQVTEDHQLIELFNTEIDQVAPLLDGCEFVPVASPCDDPPAPPPPAEKGAIVAPEPEVPGAPERAFAYIFETSFGADGEAPSLSLSIEASADPVEVLVATAASEGLRVAEAIAARIEAKELQAELLEATREELAAGLEKLAPVRITLDEARRALAEKRRQEAETLLGRPFRYEVYREDQMVGHLQARVRTEHLLQTVLANTERSQGEIPFAIDGRSTLHTTREQDQVVLEQLAVAAMPGDGVVEVADDWIVVRSVEPTTGMVFGVARPVGRGLEEIRRTAVRNLLWGLALVGLAGCGILPLTSRMTRHLKGLTSAAESLAEGDLSVRVPVRSRDEFGQLAGAFNRMASELDEHQERLLDEERKRQQQEFACRLLESENERKSDELEDARRFQLSLLPRSLPERADLKIAVSMGTATEVGGDFYDFRTAPGGDLVLTVGDATGHGAVAGTMVTVAKSLFSAAEVGRPAAFLGEAGQAIRRMRLGRMCMAMAVARFGNGQLTLSAAGMPPALVFRPATGEVEELLLPGVPLGALPDQSYREQTVALSSGETVLFMSDGLPELRDGQGEPFGYDRSQAAFAAAAADDSAPAEVVARLQAAAEAWRGSRPQDDDITLVVLRAT